MPLGSLTVSKDQGNGHVIYRDAFGNTFGARVEKMSQPSQAAAPAQPGSSTATTGGILAAATYSYRVSRIVDGVESQASTAKTQVTTGSTSTVTVTWSADPTAQAFRVYGRVGGSELLLAEVTAGSTQWIDTGALTAAGALPSATPATAVHLRIPALRGPYQRTIGDVRPATAEKQLNRYYVR